MNKDKIIKDLKERNDKLANQYRLRDIRCVHLEIENERLQQENKQLKEDKKKAIEYIKNTDNICIKDFIKEQLLEILGGKEND